MGHRKEGVQLAKEALGACERLGDVVGQGWCLKHLASLLLEDDQLDTLLNPIVLVEVLSGSTEDYDRGTKFTHYRTISSLRDYVLISTDKILVEYYTRREDASWVLREIKAGERFKLESVGCELAVDELYLKVFEG